MKAIKYRVYVTTDLVHRWGHYIDEIYIPEVQVCFNKEGGCFISSVSRVGIESEEIEVKSADAIKLKELCLFQEEKSEILEKYFV